jgi:formylmethanofuran dehydrogenase subunit E
MNENQNETEDAKDSININGLPPRLHARITSQTNTNNGKKEQEKEEENEEIDDGYKAESESENDENSEKKEKNNSNNHEEDVFPYHHIPKYIKDLSIQV